MVAGGGVVFAAILFFMYWLSGRGYKFHFAVICASLPLVFVCVGFIELVAGSPYLPLASASSEAEIPTWSGLVPQG